ncbi:MAG: glycosyltransferase family 4 protein [Nitrospirota bacterium]
MRILYVVHDFFPHFYGGTERYVLNLAKQMQRSGHAVKVLTYGLMEPVENFIPDPGGMLSHEYVYGGVPVVSIRHRTIPSDIGFIMDYREVAQLIERLLMRETFDVVHIAHPMRIGSCCEAAKSANIPVVLTLTDFWLLCPRGRFFKPDYSLCNSPESGQKCMRDCGVEPSVVKRYEYAQRLYESVDVLISPSQFLIEIFKANGWNREILHVQHGVDYKYVNPVASPMRTTDHVVFGYTGVVGKFKGVDLLLKAFQEVPATNIRLKIYGNIVFEVGFQSDLSLALEQDKRIHLMSKYSHDELARIMSELDVVIVPSTTLESYGLVVVESLAHGVPVIASDIVGSAYEFLEHGKNGLIFSIQNPSGLANIIRQISEEPSVLEKLRSNITPPPRLEEEAFIVERVYKSAIRK